MKGNHKLTRQHGNRWWSWLGEHRVMLTLVTILFLGFGLRMFSLGSESLDTLEYDWLLPVPYDSIWDGVGYDVTRRQGPLSPMLLSWMVSLGASHEALLRFPSVIWGVASILLMYFLGRRLFDEKTGLIASLLLSIMIFPLYYSQEVRGYILYLMLSLASMLVFVRLMKHPSSKGVVMLTALNSLLVTSHFMASLLVPVQIFWHFISRWRERQELSRKDTWSIIAYILPLSVAALMTYGTVNGAMGWTPGWGDCTTTISLDYLRRIVGTFLLGPGIHDPSGLFITVPSLSIFANLEGAAVWAAKVYVAIFIIAALLFFYTALRWRIQEDLFLVLWLIVPLLFLLLVSKLVVPLICYGSARHLILLFPAFVLLASRGLASARRLSFVLLALVLLVSIPLLSHYYNTPLRPPFRDAMELVEAQRGEGSLIVLPHSTFGSFAYYLGNLRLGLDNPHLSHLHPNRNGYVPELDLLYLLPPLDRGLLLSTTEQYEDLWIVGVSPVLSTEEVVRELSSDYEIVYQEELIPGPIRVYELNKKEHASLEPSGPFS